MADSSYIIRDTASQKDRAIKLIDNHGGTYSFGPQATADSIHDDLLDDPNVAIVMGSVGDSELAGAVAYRPESAVGISNVFTAGSDPVNAWQAVVANVAAIFPGLPIAGYEHGEDLNTAIAAGFSEIGPLRVWVR